MVNPEVVSVGFLHIRWYGIMAALGVVSAYWLLLKRRERYGFKSDDVSDMIFWGMVAALVGARALYVFRFWDEQFAGHVVDVFKIYEGGLVFLGGFALAVLVLLGMCRWRHWKVSSMADLFAPALPLGHAFGRIGCLLNGCCHGFRYEGLGAMRYAYPTWSTFPIQFFSAIGNVLLALGLLWLERQGKFKGYLFLVYMVIYSIGRFCLEFGRGDYPAEQLWCGLTPAQVTCLWLLPLTIAIWAVARHVVLKKQK